MNFQTAHNDCDANRPFLIALSMFSNHPGHKNFEYSGKFNVASISYETLEEGVIEIFELETCYELRRQGHFSNMINIINMLADAYGITLTLEVDESEFDLFAMYERYGFKRMDDYIAMARLPNSTCG